MDLHTFLEELERNEPEKLLRVKKPIHTKYEVTALQYALAKKGKHPVILCEKPIKTDDGQISQFPLIVNLTASRELCCKLLGISNPRRAAIEYAQRLIQKGKVRIVSNTEAPVKEVIEKGANVDLFKFPHTLQHEMNAGIYITAGYVTTYDPDTGIDNTALQRCWVKARNRTGLVPSPTTHNLNNIQKFMRRKEATPVAVWIGHHPAGLMGAQSKLGYPVSHYPAMAGALGEDVSLVPTETFGEKILVPAHAEIVIEGYVPCGVYEAEGPFGEYTGYVGPQLPAPVIEVSCVTYRRNAIYQDFALGLPDMLVLDNMAIEARIYNSVKPLIPELLNVHVPLSGKRFHAYLQLDKTRPGIGKDAILAAKPCYPRLKHIFVVDKDVDIFDDSQVLWAIATRSQWDRDLYILPGGTASPLDPSAPEGSALGCNGGIDATMPPPMAYGLPQFFQATNKVPEDVTNSLVLEDFCNADRIEKMPGTF